MTISQAQNALYLFFSKNDVFNIDENFSEIVVISIDKDKDRSIILQALQRLKTLDIVQEAKSELYWKTWWVLVKPLDAYPQTVQLSQSTTLEITRVINEYCDKMNDTENIVNPLDIQERDVKNVLSLLRMKVSEKKVELDD